MKCLTTILVVLFVLPSVAFAQEQQAAAPPVVVPAYRDSPDGLKRLVTVMVEATKNKDHQTFAAYAQSLRLPDPDVWFKGVFGEMLGAQIAESHKNLRDHLHAALLEALSGAIDDQFADLKILKLGKPCEPATDIMFYSVLLMRLRPVPMYLAQFSKPGESRIRLTGFFAFVDGAFRYLGVIQVEGVRAPSAPNVVRQGGQVQQAKLIHPAARPVYPRAARNMGMQGTVHMVALIGTNGSVDALQVLSGSCILGEEAVKTARKWRYKPTLLNGEPVVVETTIDVVFSLGR